MFFTNSLVIAITLNAGQPQESRMRQDWNDHALPNVLYAIDASCRIKV